MKVLSLFDGMSCGQIALDQLGIPVDKYYASDGQITIGYKSGKRITEFDDKRKKPVIEYV